MSGDSSEDSYTLSIFNTARMKKTMMKVKLSGKTYLIKNF